MVGEGSFRSLSNGTHWRTGMFADYKGIVLAGGGGYPAVSHNYGCVKTATTYLRQTDDLLSDFGADVGGYQKYPDYFDA